MDASGTPVKIEGQGTRRNSSIGNDRCRWLSWKDGRFADVGAPPLVTPTGSTSRQILKGEGLAQLEIVEKTLLRDPDDRLEKQRPREAEEDADGQARKTGENEVENPTISGGKLLTGRIHPASIGRYDVNVSRYYASR